MDNFEPMEKYLFNKYFEKVKVTLLNGNHVLWLRAKSIKWRTRLLRFNWIFGYNSRVISLDFSILYIYMYIYTTLLDCKYIFFRNYVYYNYCKIYFIISLLNSSSITRYIEVLSDDWFGVVWGIFGDDWENINNY